MELRDYLAIGVKWLWLFVLATAVAAVSAWVGTRFIPRTYATQTTIMVGRATANPEPNFQSIYLSQSLASTYAQMATRERVLQGVVDTLGLETSWQTIKGMVKASPVPGTQLVEIRVVDTDPLRAQVIADEVAKQLIENSPTPKQRETIKNQAFIDRQVENLQASIDSAETEVTEIDSKIGLETSARAIGDLQNRKSALQSKLETWRSQVARFMSSVEGSDVNSLEIVEEAGPGSPVGPDVTANVLLAAALGLGLALGAVLLLEYLDDTVKTGEDIDRRLGLSPLATIDVMPDADERRDTLSTLLQPRSPVAEAYRVLRTNLQFSLLGEPGAGRLVVTSANPGEGKSTTAANLAVAVAQSGKRVILIDTDLRRPSLHRFFDLPNSLGMTSLLLDENLTLDDALHPIEAVPGLSVLTSGPLPPNPAEALVSARMRGLLDLARERSDLVIMDSPPLLVVTDGAVLATEADATLLVFDCGATRTDAARKAIDALARVGIKPIGAVINRLDESKVGRYYYYYARRYSYNEYYGGGGSDGPGSAGGAGGGGRRPSRPLPEWVARLRDSVTALIG